MISFLFIFFVMFVTSAELFPADKNDGDLFVFAVNGLNMRSEPSLESRKIIKIGFGEPVKIIDARIKTSESVIDGLSGRFIRIKYKGMEGYIFSGYLSKMTPPKLTGGWSTLKDYLDYVFEKPLEKGFRKVPDPYDKSIMRKSLYFKYSDEMDYYSLGEDCSEYEILEIKNISMTEAFLLITSFNGNFMDVSLNIPEKPKSYSAEIKTAGHMQYARRITVEKDKNRQLVLISVSFDSEAGSGGVEARLGENGIVSIVFSYSCS